MRQRGFEFCRVCRQNHNQGRGHRYSNKHKQSLELLQGKMLKKIQEIRQYVKNVVPVTDRAQAQDRNKFWCRFCEQEVIEKDSSFVSAQAIKHLASLDHVKNVNSFWTENGGDLDKKHLYVIEATDLESWEKACKVKPGLVRVDGSPSNNVNDIIQPQQGSTMTSDNGKALQIPLLGLSSVQVPSVQLGEGNVHSGAAPPWLRQNLGEADSSGSLLPLSRTQQAKLSKIQNPNRVGAAWAQRRRAELEAEKNGEMLTMQGKDGSLWFPSFGRVWQSGPRRDTRKEFEAEKHAELKKNRRGRGVAKKKAISGSIEFKPYISRKQQKGRELI
ncbi:unnamed protein product [Calypogeia fissa]